METTINASKEKYDADAVWEMVKTAKTIITAKGKKVVKWNPEKDDKEEILKQLIGPSGNLRAPSFRIKKVFFTGFNHELYREHFE